MRNWTEYVTGYQGYILLTLAAGLILLGAAFLFMRNFRFRVKRGWFYYFFYGLNDQSLVSLAAGTSRLLLVASLLGGQELRLSHMVCLVILSVIWQMDQKPNMDRMRAVLMDMLHMAGTCAGLFVYRTLLRYMQDIRFAWDIQITSILLAVFILVYNLTLWLTRVPQLGKKHTTGKGRDE